MKRLTFFFCLLVVGLTSTLYAQSDPVIIYRASTSDPSQVIDKTGKIIFTIKPEYKPELEESDILGMSTYYSFDFTDGPLHVISKDSSFLMDRQGKIIAAFPRTKYRLKFYSEGMMAGWIRPEPKSSEVMIYLDSNGKEAFNGKMFTKATPFSEGHAIVQLKDSAASWQIINISGQKVADLSPDFATFIQSANPFSSGLAVVTIKPGSYRGKSHNYEYVFVDYHGKEVLNMMNVTGLYNGYGPNDFKNNLSLLRSDPYTFTLFDKSGKILARNLQSAKIDITEQLLLLAIPEENSFVGHVYDHSYKEIPLPVRKDSRVEFIFITDKYIGIYTLDSLTNAFASEILNASDMSTVYKTDKIVMDMVDEMILIGDPRSQKLLEIEDLKGNSLFGATPETRVFESFKEALPHKEQVNHLKISHEKSVDALCTFSNLRTLELYKFAGEKLPTCIGYIPNLSKLTILDSPSLTVLPKSLAKAGKFESIHLSDCPKLENLEEIITTCTSLKRVTLINTDLNQDFISKMKKERPELEIESWVMMDGN